MREHASLIRGDVAHWCLRILLLLGAISLAVSVVGLGVMIDPVRYLYALTGGWALMTSMLFLVRVARAHRWVGATVALVLLGLACWGVTAGREPDPDRLRAAYLARLHSLTGTRYVWGGESHIGIDCSGLARTALWEGMILEGIKTGNPRLLGPIAWRFWWRDMSAQAMGAGAYGYTHPIGKAKQLAGDRSATLQPGDLAVTQGGGHVLIYLGKRRWIEANPADGRVVANLAEARSIRAYFNTPVIFVRWWVLAE